MTINIQILNKINEIEREQFFRFFNLSTDIMVIADPKIKIAGRAKRHKFAKNRIISDCPGKND